MKTMLSIVLALSAITYMACTRTFEQFSNATLPMAMFLNFSILAFFGIRWGIYGRPRISIHIALLPLYALVLSVIEAVIFYSAWTVISDAYLVIHSLSPPRFLYMVLVGLLLLLIGAALFFFRLKARFFFGLSEALVGFLIGLWKIPESADPITWNLDIIFVMLTASIFLIVRGFDNMQVGLSSNPDAILKFFYDSEYGHFLSELKKDENGQPTTPEPASRP